VFKEIRAQPVLKVTKALKEIKALKVQQELKDQQDKLLVMLIFILKVRLHLLGQLITTYK
jgi:hypothetical protein